jgi:hypothetical protein
VAAGLADRRDTRDRQELAVETIAKPDELLALHDVSAELFATLQRWFEVPPEVALSLGDVDAAVQELTDPVMVAALAMRKLQALRLLSQPGVRTSSDVVVAIVQDLDRALLQAPTLRLRRAAATADWDAALEDLVADPADPADALVEVGEGAPSAATDEDPEVLRFRAGHGQLHRAVRAVLVAADGKIAHLV